MPANATEPTSSVEPVRMLELLREQVALFTKLEALATRQQGLVIGQAIEPLLSVLADRQRVSTRLAEIAGLLKPARRSWRELREQLDAGECAEADRLVASTEELLKRLIAGDERDARILSARKRRVADLLSGLNSAGSVVGAYQRKTQTVRRVDLVSEDL